MVHMARLSSTGPIQSRRRQYSSLQKISVKTFLYKLKIDLQPHKHA